MIEAKQRGFFLDRHIPIGLVLAIILQTALGLVWAGQLVQRVEFIEQRTEFIDRTSERIARLEENISFMRRSLERLERKFDDKFHTKFSDNK